MWFDPDREEPLLWSLPTDKRSLEGLSVLEGRDGTPKEVEGVPCEGGAANESEDRSKSDPVLGSDLLF